MLHQDYIGLYNLYKGLDTKSSVNKSEIPFH